MKLLLRCPIRIGCGGIACPLLYEFQALAVLLFLLPWKIFEPLKDFLALELNF